MRSFSKRSVKVRGRKTSVSLEDEFWEALQEIARARGQSLATLVGEIDASRGGANLSSHLRLFVLEHYREG